MQTNSLTKSFYKIFGLFKKHSPEIFIAAGIGGIVTSTVLACKATLKVGDVLEEHKDNVDRIHQCYEELSKEPNVDENYIVEYQKRDLTKIYTQTTMKVISLYAPSIALGALSITGLITSHHILQKRNAALAAAYATIDQGFKSYRKRVVEKYGEDVDRELRYNLKTEEVYVKEIDEETGKSKKVKKKVNTIDPHLSEFARLFGPYTENEYGDEIINPRWQPGMDYNWMFLRGSERYFNEILRIKGRVFLNEVYEYLGFPKTKAGQIVGWVYRPLDKDHNGDNFIDFGPYESNVLNTNEEDGYDTVILLDFNVDGNVWDSMLDD